MKCVVRARADKDAEEVRLASSQGAHKLTSQQEQQGISEESLSQSSRSHWLPSMCDLDPDGKAPSGCCTVLSQREFTSKAAGLLDLAEVEKKGFVLFSYGPRHSGKSYALFGSVCAPSSTTPMQPKTPRKRGDSEASQGSSGPPSRSRRLSLLSQGSNASSSTASCSASGVRGVRVGDGDAAVEGVFSVLLRRLVKRSSAPLSISVTQLFNTQWVDLLEVETPRLARFEDAHFARISCAADGAALVQAALRRRAEECFTEPLGHSISHTVVQLKNLSSGLTSYVVDMCGCDTGATTRRNPAEKIPGKFTLRDGKGEVHFSPLRLTEEFKSLRSVLVVGGLPKYSQQDEWSRFLATVFAQAEPVPTLGVFTVLAGCVKGDESSDSLLVLQNALRRANHRQRQTASGDDDGESPSSRDGDAECPPSARTTQKRKKYKKREAAGAQEEKDKDKVVQVEVQVSIQREKRDLVATTEVCSRPASGTLVAREAPPVAQHLSLPPRAPARGSPTTVAKRRGSAVPPLEGLAATSNRGAGTATLAEPQPAPTVTAPTDMLGLAPSPTAVPRAPQESSSPTTTTVDPCGQSLNAATLDFLVGMEKRERASITEAEESVRTMLFSSPAASPQRRAAKLTVSFRPTPPSSLSSSAPDPPLQSPRNESLLPAVMQHSSPVHSSPILLRPSVRFSSGTSFLDGAVGDAVPFLSAPVAANLPPSLLRSPGEESSGGRRGFPTARHHGDGSGGQDEGPTPWGLPPLHIPPASSGRRRHTEDPSSLAAAMQQRDADSVSPPPTHPRRSVSSAHRRRPRCASADASTRGARQRRRSSGADAFPALTLKQRNDVVKFWETFYGAELMARSDIEMTEKRAWKKLTVNESKRRPQ